MKNKAGIEYIKVFIDYKDGKTACICKRENKLCKRIVLRM